MFTQMTIESGKIWRFETQDWYQLQYVHFGKKYYGSLHRKIWKLLS